MTQIERVIDYVNKFGSISPMEAFSDLGITKLATVISRDIANGGKWEKTFERSKNRFGESVHFMRYRLED